MSELSADQHAHLFHEPKIVTYLDLVRFLAPGLLPVELTYLSRNSALQRGPQSKMLQLISSLLSSLAKWFP